MGSPVNTATQPSSASISDSLLQIREIHRFTPRSFGSVCEVTLMQPWLTPAVTNPGAGTQPTEKMEGENYQDIIQVYFPALKDKNLQIKGPTKHPEQYVDPPHGILL